MFSSNQSDDSKTEESDIKIKISQDLESSKYKGPPLIQPHIPEPYKVKRFEADPNDSALQKAGSYLRFATERFITYLADIIFLRRDPVVFKTT